MWLQRPADMFLNIMVVIKERKATATRAVWNISPENYVHMLLFHAREIWMSYARHLHTRAHTHAHSVATIDLKLFTREWRHVLVYEQLNHWVCHWFFVIRLNWRNLVLEGHVTSLRIVGWGKAKTRATLVTCVTNGTDTSDKATTELTLSEQSYQLGDWSNPGNFGGSRQFDAHNVHPKHHIWRIIFLPHFWLHVWFTTRSRKLDSCCWDTQCCLCVWRMWTIEWSRL